MSRGGVSGSVMFFPSNQDLAASPEMNFHTKHPPTPSPRRKTRAVDWSVGWVLPPIIHSLFFSNNLPFLLQKEICLNAVCRGYIQWNLFS